MTQAPPDRAVTAHVVVDHASAVHHAATLARRTARVSGLDAAAAERAAVLTTELAGNLLRHAVGGAVYVQCHPLGGGVDVVAVDRGPGMASPDRAMVDGFSTAGTLGSGMGAARRLADELTLRTLPGIGTLICARLRAADSAPARADLGLLCLPVRGESACGDSAAVVDAPGGRTAMVVDGLGHGVAAAEAAAAAVAAFRAAPERPLPELLSAMDRALRSGRGAAVGLVRLRPGSVEHCGIGNVRMLLVAQDGVRSRALGQPGVVGWNMPRPLARTLPMPQECAAVVHSDGIAARWADDAPPFLLGMPPRLLAAALGHGHRSARDDATALVSGAARRST
ncbi:SpoIIE family protein phosphatase [Streptomyces sp. VRA16 Mangrove soil]|uniref:SpoIIE family protein phosphatase n=1 Tax=Streptomyces sp. VRA16 Mangrove soil TaxID=2817434 RepID=UPI001A9E02C5|nr:SpoIIE family protein phosphatase [Streptomyces sp. VRA16 Mangrove soil]MBO1331565.1 SpoIIE family protein phosphatase [Streptomyces sp. VRA16 Mangrove soil]